MPQLLVFVLFFAGLYFLMLRPQQQRVRRQRELITAIGIGDRVVTAGGLIGRVVDDNGDRLWVEIADGVTVEFLRLAISRRLDEGEEADDGAAGDGEENAEDELGDGEPGDAAVAGSEAAPGVEEAASPSEPAGGDDGAVPGDTTEGAAAPAPGPDPR